MGLKPAKRKPMEDLMLARSVDTGIVHHVLCREGSRVLIEDSATHTIVWQPSARYTFIGA